MEGINWERLKIMNHRFRRYTQIYLMSITFKSVSPIREIRVIRG